MTRTLALICIVSLLFVGASAGAEAAFSLADLQVSELYQLYEKTLFELNSRNISTSESPVTETPEILFRSIPWGSNTDDYLSAVIDSGISASPQPAAASSWETKVDDDDLEAIYQVDDAGFYIRSSPKDLVVAGYPVSTVLANFMFSFDESDVYTDEANSQLYKASYTFDAVDKRAAFLMLTEKMNTLYGSGIPGSCSSHWWSTGGDFTGTSEWVMWYGLNDTAVYLKYHYEIYDEGNALKEDALSLVYGKSNSIELIQRLEAAMAREQAKDATTSFDGL